MFMKLLAGLAIAVGIVLLALGLLADVLGLGSHPGFGWTQLGSTIAGLIVLAAGIAWSRRASAIGSGAGNRENSQG